MADSKLLVVELLAHSEEDAAVEFAMTSTKYQDVISRTLGEKHQWYFVDFRGFLEVYYTSVLTQKAIKYLSPGSCFKWALREGNLGLADIFFQHRLFVDPEYLQPKHYSYIPREQQDSNGYSNACLSSRENVVDWVIQLYKSYSLKFHISSTDIYSAVQSGNINILKKLLTLAQDLFQDPSSIISLSSGSDQMIYYVCLSNDVEMFKFVRSYFDFSPDWDRVYSCAYNTMADKILELIKDTTNKTPRYLGLFLGENLPINPHVYDQYSEQILQTLHGDVNLSEFFTLVERGVKDRNFSDRYVCLKKLDFLIRESSEPNIVSFGEEIIPQAVMGSFVNIANFFLQRGYSIGMLTGTDDFSWSVYGVPANPIVNYWYRKPTLLSPTIPRDFKRYLISYHKIDETHNPFIPSGVSIEWLIDKFLELEEADCFRIHGQSKEILDYLWVDHRFDPNYRLIDMVKVINRRNEKRESILRTLFKDPRIDVGDLKLQELAGDVISQLPDNILINIHTNMNLSLADKFAEIRQIIVKEFSLDFDKFEKYYLMSLEELAAVLNSHQVPWIPHFNRLIASLFMSGYRPYYTPLMDNLFAPLSTYVRMSNVLEIMEAKSFS